MEKNEETKEEVQIVPPSEEQENGLNKVERSLERTKIYIPLDIVISLLRPDELEKLRKYIASYLGRH